VGGLSAWFLGHHARRVDAERVGGCEQRNKSGGYKNGEYIAAGDEDKRCHWPREPAHLDRSDSIVLDLFESRCPQGSRIGVETGVEEESRRGTDGPREVGFERAWAWLYCTVQDEAGAARAEDRGSLVLSEVR
jgi:hypothetical protein